MESNSITSIEWDDKDPMGQNADILDGEFIKRHYYGSNNDIKGKNK
jgi:hypothetical protein